MYNTPNVAYLEKQRVACVKQEENAVKSQKDFFFFFFF